MFKINKYILKNLEGKKEMTNGNFKIFKVES